VLVVFHDEDAGSIGAFLLILGHCLAPWATCDDMRQG
jgi:hypothetical protein